MNKTEKLEQVYEFLENLGAYTQGSWDGLHDALVTVGDLIADQSAQPATTLTRKDCFMLLALGRHLADYAVLSHREKVESLGKNWVLPKDSAVYQLDLANQFVAEWFPTDPTDQK